VIPCKQEVIMVYETVDYIVEAHRRIIHEYIS
jgi:hypothetical protein